MEFFSDVLFAVAALLVFAYSLQLRTAIEPNNWVRVCIGFMGLSFALYAASTFSSAQTASSAQLFAFACYLLGSIGGALAAVTLRRGNWKVLGLTPGWERSSSSAK